MDKKEIWVPITGYEGLYEVSNFGNVRSLNYDKTGKIKNMKTFENSNGYMVLTLSKNGKYKQHFVHRLVAEAFIPNLFNGIEINHIDENPKNNCVDNLEWCSKSYNINYGSRNKRCAEKQSKPVLQYTKYGELVKEWSSISECGRNGFGIGHISDCCKGKLKSHKGFIWKYKNDGA